MADKYVRSTDGSDADDGSTWALAEATGAGAAAADSAGDRIFFADGHSEAAGANIAWAWAGTLAAPTMVLAVVDTGDPEPPTAIAAARVPIHTTGNNSIVISGYVYTRKFDFQTSTTPASNNTARIDLGNAASKQTYVDCNFYVNSTNAGVSVNVGGANSTVNTSIEVECIDCDFRLGAAGQSVTFAGVCRVSGGGFASGGTSPTTAFSLTGGEGSIVLIEDFDLSVLDAGVDLFVGGAAAQLVSRAVIRNSDLPASWSGTLLSTAFTSPNRVEMHNCDAGDVNYALWVEDQSGSTRHETTIIRTGARTDGTTNVSWKVVANANAEFPLVPHVCPEIRVWSETVGSVTIKIPFVHDDATDAKTNEIGMDIHYAGTSGSPLYLLATTDENPLGSFANHADATSDDNWGTTGFTNENEQRMSLTFTTAEKGWIIIIPKVYEASKTVYIDPDPQIS